MKRHCYKEAGGKTYLVQFAFVNICLCEMIL